LIEQLAGGLTPVRARSIAREAVILTLIVALELALLAVTGEFRPDLSASLLLPQSWWRFGGLGLLAVMAGWCALASYAPDGKARLGRQLTVLTAIALVAVGWVIDASETAAAGSIAERLMWRNGIDCVVTMLILAVAPLITLGILMRRGAAADLAASATASSFAGAGFAALVFSFNCPHDDPLYVVVWYAIGIALITFAGRLILPRLTRW
ncbi:MAG: NrsF family protein, partial [Sphingomicrobium sp.]